MAARNHTATPGTERAPSGNVALITAELAVTRCRWCNDDLEHCHDALVMHAVGETHCMAPDCTTPAELHHMVVACEELGCTCATSYGSAAAVTA
jgi:hypothetical protein